MRCRKMQMAMLYLSIIEWMFLASLATSLLSFSPTPKDKTKKVLAISPGICYDNNALMCVYSNKEVDSHG